MTGERVPLAMATESYDRYGGLCQTYPLTADQQKYDDTCRAIDALEVEIGALSAGLFTATELGWFTWFTQKTFMFPNQEQLDAQMKLLTTLRETLRAREAPK